MSNTKSSMLKPVFWLKKFFVKCVKYSEYVSAINTLNATITKLKNSVETIKESHESASDKLSDELEIKNTLLEEKDVTILRLTNEAELAVTKISEAKITNNELVKQVKELEHQIEHLTTPIPSVDECAEHNHVEEAKPDYRTTPLKKKEVESIFKLKYVENETPANIARAYNLDLNKVQDILAGKIYYRYKFLKKYTQDSK